MNIISFAVRRPVLVSVCFILLSVLGLFSINRLTINLTPKVNLPIVTVTTVYPGAGPEQVETKVTKPLEDAVSTTNGLKHIFSYSVESVSIIVAEFTMSVSPEVAAADVREKISAARAGLPDEAEDPEVARLDINATPVLYVALSAPDLREAYTVADRRIKPALQAVPGVGNVDIVGGLRREIRVEADPDKLAVYGVDLQTVAGRLARENVNIPAGRYTLAGREVAGRTSSEFASVRDINAVLIPTKASGTVPLSAIATVRDTYAEVRSLAKVDGKDAVAFVIRKQPNANTVEVVDSVRKEVSRLEKQLPASYRFDIIVDNSTFIREAVADVATSLILGILITGLVLFFFLHTVGSTLIVTLTIPISLVTTMFFMYLSGFSLNVLSLSSLAICLGGLVDASVVVLENIFRHATQLRKKLSDATVEGTVEVIGAVMTSILTNIVVFLPVAFMSGIIGQFFREFGLVQVFATIVSLAVSLSLLPMLASRLLKPGRENRFGVLWEEKFSLLRERYRNGLTRVLTRPALLFSIVALLLAASVGLLPLVGSEFMPTPDQGVSSITLRMPPGTALEKTSQVVAAIEEHLRTLPELKRTFSTIGSVSGGTLSPGQSGPEYAQIMAQWKDERKRDAFAIIREVRPFLAAIPGAVITVREASSVVGGGGAPFQIYVSGPDWPSVEEAAPRVFELVQKTEGVADSDISAHPGKPEIAVIPEREKLAELGLAPDTVGIACRAALEGVVPTTLREGDDEYDIRVTIPAEARSRREILEKLPLRDSKGRVFFLAQVADIADTFGPTTRERYDRTPAVGITANLNKPLGTVLGTFQNLLNQQELPSGVRIIRAGQAEMMGEAFRDLSTALLLSIILVYLVMAAQFESWTEPFILMGSLPFAVIGIIFGMFLFDKTLNVFSMMGFIILTGVGVNNGILIIAFAKERFERGADALASVVEAASVRLKPILMTSLALITGTIPLAFQPGKAAVLKSPMGVVIISGAFSCTLLTLFAIPFLYYNVLKRRERRRQPATPS